MQTCSSCNASSPDGANTCVHCRADLRQFSTTSVALKKFQKNPRVQAVRISVAGDSCPHCREFYRTYPKNSVPILPHTGCSHEHGCRCFYEPVLSEMTLY